MTEPDNERTRNAVKVALLEPSRDSVEQPRMAPLERRLRARGRIRGEAGIKYAVEVAERILGLGRTTHTKAANRVPPAQRPTIERIVTDELLAGGWPGHVTQRIDERLN